MSFFAKATPVKSPFTTKLPGEAEVPPVKFPAFVIVFVPFEVSDPTHCITSAPEIDLVANTLLSPDTEAPEEDSANNVVSPITAVPAPVPQPI